MTLPSDFWQLPAIAVMAILIIGWLLWTQREERRRIAEERITEQASSSQERLQYAQYIQQLLNASEEDRQQYFDKLAELVKSGILAQEHATAAIAALTESFCREMETHESRTEQRFKAHEEKAMERHQVLVERISAYIPVRE